MIMRVSGLLCLLLLSTTFVARGFYLPGVAPREYDDGETVELKVNKLSSSKTQLPFEYYSLPFCRPGKIESAAESLGEILFGDRIENSLYTLEMKVNIPGNGELCRAVCDPRQYSTSEMKEFREKIQDEYRVEMVVDNLPIAQRRSIEEDGEMVDVYEQGFPLGFEGDPKQYSGSREGKTYINNHLQFNIMYHEDKSYKGVRIVGFEVIPSSVKHVFDPHDANPLHYTCPYSPSVNREMQDVDHSGEIIWSYEIKWTPSNIKWASRWDLYLKMTNAKIHWFSVINSMVYALFLAGIVAIIMMRVLKRDLVAYNQSDDDEDIEEETGWKLVHSDVFRTPVNCNLLSVLNGTGSQLFGCFLATLTFAVLGFLSPANRGGLMTALLLLFVFMGVLSGFVSSRLFKMYRQDSWKKNTLWTAFLFPSWCFALFLFLNFFIWGEKSSGAVPFLTLLSLFALWFGVSVPLVFVGSYLGFRKKAIQFPVRTNQIPRQIPEKRWYLRKWPLLAVGGSLPFGVVYFEMSFIMSSLWLNRVYYMFTFLFIVFVILCITCAEISIVLTYFQLCSEDYQWHWNSYLIPGFSAVYLFLYSMMYFFARLEIVKFVSSLMYFGYMLMVSSFFFALTGTIGYLSTLFFTLQIYSAVKCD